MPRAQPPAGGPIYLIGFMGVGKTSTGRLLAGGLGLPFLDLDQVICERTGLTIPDLFATRGEEGFRRCEAEALAAISTRTAVIAVGGGAPTVAGNLARMQQTGTVVLLSADTDTLVQRLSAPAERGARPLLATATRGSLASRIAELLAQRAAAYAQADLVVDTNGRDPAMIAAEIARQLPGSRQAEDECLWIDAPGGRYPVYIDAAGPTDKAADAVADRLVARLLLVLPALASGPRAARLGLVTDENVARLHLPRYQAALARRGITPVTAVIPAGEAHKSLMQVERVAGLLLAGGVDRGSALLSLGGGLVSDLTGFVAATLLRGVPWAAVATTLLSQADAAIGGKTAVNLPAGKNLIGAFHHPRLVFADVSALATLPPGELCSGLGEVLKHALLLGEAEVALLEAQAEAARAGDPALLQALLRGCAAYKGRVVAADPEERDPRGGRMLLNLGHTIGHALETASAAGPEPLRHGEAVALGLVAMARVSARRFPDSGAACALPERLSRLLPRLGLPTDLDRRLFDPDTEGLAAPVHAALLLDKKRAAEVLRFIALRRPGDAVPLDVTVPELLDALHTADPSPYQVNTMTPPRPMSAATAALRASRSEVL